MKPTQSQVKKWHNMIQRYVEKYSVMGCTYPNVQHHHVVGRTYIHNKIHIGQWFVIPLPVFLHDVSSNDECNVTHYPKNFVKAYGLQSSLWWNMCCKMMANDWGELPFDNDVVEAIRDTKK